MHNLDELKDKLCDELNDYARKEKLGAGELEIVHKLTDTIKNISKIEMLEDEDGYSRDGDWEARGNYGRGNSYANRGQHYVRGHYSRDGRMMDDDYSMARGRRRDDRGRYSRDDGREYLVKKLREEMRGADSEREREIFKRAINILEED